MELMEKAKKTVYSGIQPSGTFTIGNYLGAMRNWVPMQDQYDCIYAIADLHALTVPQVPAELRKRTYESVAMLLAIGIDPQKSILYVQSHVPAHTELTWLLNCNAYMGELSRMTQYKDKSERQGKNIRVALFDYPVLMAADILLYETDLVPVGDDQKQHVELVRDLAGRFNQNYSPTFVLPEPYFGESGTRLMSLQDPSRKMSKSDENQNAYVSMTDQPQVIRNKFKRAITDSIGKVQYDKTSQPGIANLMDIYSSCTGRSYEEIEKEFEGKGYGDFKMAVGEAVVEVLEPIQQTYNELIKDKANLDNLMKENAQKAAVRAQKVLRKVRRKVGLVG
ncbi:MAG: tryptophan--tRNA ligase [Eubacteriaceae bacterium]|nr:tryptophan--tRNA ligase [Eubacteriaceae bacterium]